MKRILLAITLVAIGLLSASPASATEPKVESCTHDNVDCGEWPDEVPAGTPCKIYVDGEWLEGETNEYGQCVCEYVPPTTSTTYATTTTTTAPTTTSTTVAPTTSTTVVAPSTTVTTLLPSTAPPTTAGDANLYANCAEVIAAGRAPLVEGEVGYRPGLDVDGDGQACETEKVPFHPAQRPASSTGQLPRTGSSTGLYVGVGAILIAGGAALVTYASRRRFI